MKTVEYAIADIGVKSKAGSVNGLGRPVEPSNDSHRLTEAGIKFIGPTGHAREESIRAPAPETDPGSFETSP